MVGPYKGGLFMTLPDNRVRLFEGVRWTSRNRKAAKGDFNNKRGQYLLRKETNAVLGYFLMNL